MNQQIPPIDIIILSINLLSYVLITKDIVSETIRYRPSSKFRVNLIKISLLLSSVCWVYFSSVYAVVVFGYFMEIDTYINLSNFREYTRIVGVLLVASTGFIINKTIGKIRLLEEIEYLKQAGFEDEVLKKWA